MFEDLSDYRLIPGGFVLLGVGTILLLLTTMIAGPMDLIITLLVIGSLLAIAGVITITVGWRRRSKRYRRRGR